MNSAKSFLKHAVRGTCKDPFLYVRRPFGDTITQYYNNILLSISNTINMTEYERESDPGRLHFIHPNIDMLYQHIWNLMHSGGSGWFIELAKGLERYCSCVHLNSKYIKPDFYKKEDHIKIMVSDDYKNIIIRYKDLVGHISLVSGKDSDKDGTISDFLTSTIKYSTNKNRLHNIKQLFSVKESSYLYVAQVGGGLWTCKEFPFINSSKRVIDVEHYWRDDHPETGDAMEQVIFDYNNAIRYASRTSNASLYNNLKTNYGKDKSGYYPEQVTYKTYYISLRNRMTGGKEFFMRVFN